MSFDILVVVTTEASGPYLLPLVAAAQRADVSIAVFLTNDGVKLASDQALGQNLRNMETVVMCAESWSTYLPDEKSPVTSGSQTDHSQMIGSAGVVISL